MDDLKTQALTKIAARLGRKVILKSDDLPKSFARLNTDKIDGFTINKRVVIDINGWIYTADPEDTGELESIKNQVTRHGLLDRGSLQVIPTHPSVIDSLLGGHDELKKVTEGLIAEEHSQARKDIDEILRQGKLLGTSDIHITARRTGVTIEVKVNGQLRELNTHHKYNHAHSMCSVLVDLFAASTEGGSSTHFKVTEPTDATFVRRVDGETVKIRFSSTPCAGGFKAVLRIFASNSVGGSSLTLSKLGYQADHIALIESVTKKPHGLVMVAGPTGSGKTTTLAVMMAMMPANKALYSYEDPVEIDNDRICQVMVVPGSEACDWGHFAKSVLRLDPDVVQYGELREISVAEQIVATASTGHLVLSTIHANSAPLVVQRMEDLGLSYKRLGEPELLELLVFQRLIGRSCSACSEPLSLCTITDPYIQKKIERLRSYFNKKSRHEKVSIACRGKSCNTCNGTGISGRVLVAEVVKVDDKGREFIRRGEVSEWIQYLKKQGWKSTLDHAERLTQAGYLCPITAEDTLGKQFDDESYGESFSYEIHRAETLNVLRSKRDIEKHVSTKNYLSGTEAL
jgi:general secretion pathway protein E